MYVPFWLFDGGAEGEVDYKAANSRTYRDDDYEVTETDHYDVHRGGSIAFEKIPVDASSKMPDDHMDSIEPFDYTQMQPFSTAYLPGYLADKYDVTVDDSRARADRRSRETLENALRETVTGYGTCVTDRTDIRLHRGKVHYALLPVRHERTDRQACRRPADRPRPLLGHVRCDRRRGHGRADGHPAVYVRRRTS